MTYKLDPVLSHIISPVRVYLPSGARQRFKNGTMLCNTTFNQKYQVTEIKAVDGVIEITLKEDHSLHFDSFF